MRKLLLTAAVTTGLTACSQDDKVFIPAELEPAAFIYTGDPQRGVRCFSLSLELDIKPEIAKLYTDAFDGLPQADINKEIDMFFQGVMQEIKGIKGAPRYYAKLFNMYDDTCTPYLAPVAQTEA